MEYHALTEAERLALRHLAALYFHGDESLRSITAESGEDGVTVTISAQNKTVSKTEPLKLWLHKERGRAKNAALGKAFALAAKSYTSYTPPYGNLFGVRPVKVPLFYLEHGLSEESVLSLLKDEFFVSPEKARLLTELAKKEQLFAKEVDERDGMLYVSIPFCPSRCNYCSFISSSAPKHLSQIPAYLTLLEEEIRKTASLFRRKGKRLAAVYVGGGTPGILNETELARLLERIGTEFSLTDTKEFCVEIGRPDTITEEKLRILKGAGVHRICINPQTTNDKTLARIGRRHSADDYDSAMNLAKKFGFSSINCDLIAGLEGETAEDFLSSVEKVLSFDPENLTVHALCQKRAAENKALFSEAEDFRAAMDTAHGLCKQKGLSPYYLYRQKNAVADLENLGFSKKGKDCVYNVAMMEELCDIFAVGAGAISKILPKKKGGKILRFAAYKYPYEYLSDPEKIDENLRQMGDIL